MKSCTTALCVAFLIAAFVIPSQCDDTRHMITLDVENYSTGKQFKIKCDYDIRLRELKREICEQERLLYCAEYTLFKNYHGRKATIQQNVIVDGASIFID